MLQLWIIRAWSSVFLMVHIETLVINVHPRADLCNLNQAQLFPIVQSLTYMLFHLTYMAQLSSQNVILCVFAVPAAPDNIL